MTKPDQPNPGMYNCTIGIAIGDITGIGPEVALKALALETFDESTRFLLIGDDAHLRSINRKLNLHLDLQTCARPPCQSRFSIHQPNLIPMPERLPQGAPEAALNALMWLRDGAKRCQAGEIDALVTGPVNKQAILRAGHTFVGQTEYLSQLTDAKRTAMMLLGRDDQGRPLRVMLATTHLPLRQVAGSLTVSGIQTVIELAATACQQLRLTRARIGVCGLNPHAGEGGLVGTEEQDLVAPAVRAAQANGLDVSGPHPADTLFHQAYRGDYDVVVALYHDQGLAPLKMIAFDHGVNWTVGLPFIRTSPDHGTAYDLAGRGTANPSSMRAAMKLAHELATSRTLPPRQCPTRD